jgi:type VI secretion system protein ImpH
MGTIARGKLPHLIEDLLRTPSAYGLFQALHLIETHLAEEEASGDEIRKFIDLAPAAEITFPAGEIRYGRVDESARYRLELNFMGFCGVDSPLPQFFNDIATFDTPQGVKLRGFLELFNQRIYHLLYEAWKKMNLHGSRDGRTSLYCRYLEALYGGSGTCRISGRFDYAGIVATRVKNSQSLAGMLEDFLHCPVTVKQNVPCWIDLEETATLGGGYALGDKAMLGNRLMDVNSKIRLSIGPLPGRDAADLLPGRSAALTLSAMIRDYLDPTIQYDLELWIQPEAGDDSMLGGDQAILGWTTCLGKAGGSVNRIHLAGDSLDRGRETAKC